MPASPITKEITGNDFQKDWSSLEKVIIPDQATYCYWGVWFNETGSNASLMWCPIDDDPSVNDHWRHAEEIDDSCRNALTAIKSVYGVSFHESIWVDITPEQVVKDNPLV